MYRQGPALMGYTLETGRYTYIYIYIPILRCDCKEHTPQGIEIRWRTADGRTDERSAPTKGCNSSSCGREVLTFPSVTTLTQFGDDPSPLCSGWLYLFDNVHISFRFDSLLWLQKQPASQPASQSGSEGSRLVKPHHLYLSLGKRASCILNYSYIYIYVYIWVYSWVPWTLSQPFITQRHITCMLVFFKVSDFGEGLETLIWPLRVLKTIV